MARDSGVVVGGHCAHDGADCVYARVFEYGESVSEKLEVTFKVIFLRSVVDL